ncbi:MAG: histidine phosphatase family protein [Lacipirellulaceae bacterium]
MNVSPEYATPDCCLMHLVRHGATPPNLIEPPIMQGDGIDEPLAPVGIDQARRVAERLAGVPIAAVYSSPMKRSMETAALIAERHALVVEPVEALREVRVGVWEGLTWPTVERDDPQRYHLFRDDPERHGYPGGETLRELYERTAPALAELMQRHVGQQIAVVAHSVVNRVYLGEVLGVSLAKGRDIAQANCSISQVRWQGRQPRVLTLNEVGHLA